MAQLRNTAIKGSLAIGDIDNLYERLIDLNRRLSDIETLRNNLEGIENFKMKTGTFVTTITDDSSSVVFNPATTALKTLFELDTTPRVRDYHVAFMNGDGVNSVHVDGAQSFQEDANVSNKNRIYVNLASRASGNIRYNWVAIYNPNLIE